MSQAGARWRARGEDISILSALLHDGSVDPRSGRHDTESGEHVLPLLRLELAAPKRERYLFVTVLKYRWRECTLRVSNVEQAAVRWNDPHDAKSDEAVGGQNFEGIRRTPDGLVLECLLGDIELSCRGEPTVEVEDGRLTNEFGMTQVGAADFWTSLAAELERLRVEDAPGAGTVPG